MFEYESVVTPQGIPLQAQVEELRRRAQTVARLQGGHTHYLEEVRIFREYIEEHRFLLRRSKASLNLPPDEEGNEHQVWFLPEESRFIKVTWPDFFGLSVLYRQDEDSHASPIAYLERWQLHNELFGDNVEFVGVLMEGTKMRLVIQQPAIEGIPASVEHIHRFFAESGWTRFEVAGEVAFFDSERCVVISDTHQGNLILMEDGLLAPIDLRVQPLSGALLDYVQRVCQKNS